MRPSRVQFAPDPSEQGFRNCNRRSVHFSRTETRRGTASAFAVPARNVRITWKVILLVWLALMAAALLLHASMPTPVVTSVATQPMSVGTVTITTR